MTTVFAVAAIILAICLAGTLFAYADMRQELEDDLADRDVQIKRLEARVLAQRSDGVVVPLNQSLRFARVADILAANEAQRFDPDGADWGGDSA